MLTGAMQVTVLMIKLRVHASTFYQITITTTARLAAPLQSSPHRLREFIYMYGVGEGKEKGDPRVNERYNRIIYRTR